MGGDEVLVLKLSLVSACISFTLAEAAIFKGIRAWVKKRSAFLGKLVSCGYCTGFWVSFGLVANFQPTLFFSSSPTTDFLFTGLTTAWLSGLQGALWGMMSAIAEKPKE